MLAFGPRKCRVDAARVRAYFAALKTVAAENDPAQSRMKVSSRVTRYSAILPFSTLAF
jgi:hypothetical protein